VVGGRRGRCSGTGGGEDAGSSSTSLGGIGGNF
jgi:hypothetical protein